jgi:deazaflavin-dependent oxidoreductase (nitroreductase family)
MPDTPASTPTHYRKPGWFTVNVVNRLVGWLTRRGVSVWGSRVLEVRGRTTGQPRRTPVNLLTHEGRHYLVSPRGEGQWVRNARAADGRLTTIVGHRREEWVGHELTDAEKVPVLRAYLRRWKAEVGVFFDGTSADSTDVELAAIAPRHPVFVLEAADDAEATEAEPTDTEAGAADAEATEAEATDDVTDTEAAHSDTRTDDTEPGA